MRQLIVAVSTAALLSGPCPALARSITFSFDSLSTGAGTPITLTSDGVSATFTASGDPGGFQIVPSYFSFPGNVIETPGASFQDFEALNIAFSMPLASFSGPFATDVSGPLDLTASLGVSEAGTASSTGAIPFGYTYPEGTISFNGAKFNGLVLSVPNDPDFALGSFTVTIPEPSTWALMLAGFAGVGVVAARRASRSRRAFAA